MKSKTRKIASYYAPLPVGHGLMILQEEDVTHRIAASSVIHLQSNGNPATMVVHYGKGDYHDYHRFKDIPVSVIEDMYFRALRGEIARSAEYHENGARLDGTPLLINQDYEAKLKLMAQRQNAVKSEIKLDDTHQQPASENQLSSIEPEVAKLPDGQVSAEALALAAPETATVATSIMSAPLPPVTTIERKPKSQVAKEEKSEFEIGELVEGKGVFIGVYTKIFNKSSGIFSSQEITREFNVFTTPEDLKNEDGSQLTGKFEDVLAAVARIENICGHPGTRIERNTAFIEHTVSDGYKRLENWFIPSHKILRDYIHLNRAKGVLSGTFNLTQGDKTTNEYPSYYASLDYQEFVLDFYSGESFRTYDSRKRSVRPVRLELRT